MVLKVLWLTGWALQNFVLYYSGVELIVGMVYSTFGGQMLPGLLRVAAQTTDTLVMLEIWFKNRYYITILGSFHLLRYKTSLRVNLCENVFKVQHIRYYSSEILPKMFPRTSNLCWRCLNRMWECGTVKQFWKWIHFEIGMVMGFPVLPAPHTPLK